MRAEIEEFFTMDENNTIGGWMRFTWCTKHADYDEGAVRTPLNSPGEHTDVNQNVTYEVKTIEYMDQERGEKDLPRTTWT
eukprot:16061857-Heterocapsa_arctica.AAC.1